MLATIQLHPSSAKVKAVIMPRPIWLPTLVTNATLHYKPGSIFSPLYNFSLPSQLAQIIAFKSCRFNMDVPSQYKV